MSVTELAGQSRQLLGTRRHERCKSCRFSARPLGQVVGTARRTDTKWIKSALKLLSLLEQTTDQFFQPLHFGALLLALPPELSYLAFQL